MKHLKDQKAALSDGSKPDITHVRNSFLVYCARPCEYGNDKYERANYLRKTDGEDGNNLDFQRFRAYLRAARSHIGLTLDAMERHQANDPELKDKVGMKDAVYAEDTDATGGAADEIGPSGLPHVCGAVASLMMAIEQAVNCGLLPKDPGQPWKVEEIHNG